MSCQGSKPELASRPVLTGQRANQSMSGRSVAICSRKTATLTTISAWVTGGMGRNAMVPRRRRSSGVQLRVAAEDPLLVERDAALRAQVSAESRPPGDEGELQVVQPEPVGLAPGRKAQAGAEVEEDVRGLGDQQLAGAQERRRERRSLDRRALQQTLHRPHAARTARNVDVIGARVLEREADELAAALNGGPVIERVSHRIICVWIVRDSSLPESSVTRVWQTCVRLPLWRAVDSARSLPAVAAAKKLVFDSSVAVFRPIAEVPTAPMVSANAISVPPCTAPVVVFRCSPISSSPTTRSGATSTRRIPRCAISPVFH